MKNKLARREYARFTHPNSTATRFPGPTANGYLLPNGWHITPVGRQIETTDLLLNILPMKDSKHAVIPTSGLNEHNIALVNIDTGSNEICPTSRTHGLKTTNVNA